jgi:hypothetical protein
MVVLLRSCLVDSIHALVDAITVLAALGGESTPVQKDIEGDETISTFLRRGYFDARLTTRGLLADDDWWLRWSTASEEARDDRASQAVQETAPEADTTPWRAGPTSTPFAAGFVPGLLGEVAVAETLLARVHGDGFVHSGWWQHGGIPLLLVKRFVNHDLVIASRYWLPKGESQLPFNQRTKERHRVRHFVRSRFGESVVRGGADLGNGVGAGAGRAANQAGDCGAETVTQGSAFEIAHGEVIDRVDFESPGEGFLAAIHFLFPYVIVFTNCER